jgi:Uma2 family endonuclease
MARAEAVSSVTIISVEQYLSTSYRPDCDYVEGEVRERNVGEYEHGRLQALLTIWFGNHERDWNIRVIVEQRIRVASRRYRIPDVCIIDRDQPIEPVFTRPPLICIEILSKDDSLRDMQERVTDYLHLGVPNVWILDPLSHRVYICAPGEFREPVGGVLEALGTAIRIPLDEIFAELD